MSLSRLIRLALGVFVGIAILLALKSSKFSWGQRGTRVTPCVCYSREEVTQFLKAANLDTAEYPSLRRNEARNKVYTCLRRASNEPVLVLFSSEGTSITTAPASMVYLNSADEVVAWSDDLSKGVQFANGYFLRLPEFGLFDVSPSGEYFIVGAKPTSTWIGHTARPESRTCISSNVLASRVFEAGGKLYVAGQTYNRGPGGQFSHSTICLVLSPHSNGFELVNAIHLPISASLEDISETGEQILLKEVTEFSSNWLLANARTLKTQRFESSASWCFFLKPKPLTRHSAD